MIKFPNQVVPPPLKIVIISANNADPDEMLHSAVPTYSPGVTVPGIQRIKKLSKQLVLKVASNLLSSSYSLYCLL